MLSPQAPRSSTCTGRGDTGTLGSIETNEKYAEVVVYTVERGRRGHVPAEHHKHLAWTRLGKSFRARGRTALAGKNTSSSKENSATGSPQPRSSSSVAILGRPVSSLTYR